jgi:hypothetical protein
MADFTVRKSIGVFLDFMLNYNNSTEGGVKYYGDFLFTLTTTMPVT